MARKKKEANGQFSEFGKLVISIREGAELKQGVLAKAAKISQSYLSAIEAGRVGPPQNGVLVLLAKACDYDPDEMLLLAGRIPPTLHKVIHKEPEKVANLLRKAGYLGAKRGGGARKTAGV
jgi:transcriptional regulator with XRE-family HTH domain